MLIYKLPQKESSLTSITSGGFSVSNSSTDINSMENANQKLKCNKAKIKNPLYYAMQIPKQLPRLSRTISRHHVHTHPKGQSFYIRVTTLVIWQLILIFRDLKKLSLQTILPLLSLIIYFFAVNGDIRNIDLGIGE